MVDMVFLLLLLFQAKHFLADYPLQGKYMLGKFKDEGWVGPLAAHAGVHALGTLLITMFFVPPHIALILAGIDFFVHFTVDRVKARCPFTMRDKKFWWALGADQMAHHLTHYWIIFEVVMMANGAN